VILIIRPAVTVRRPPSFRVNRNQAAAASSVLAIWSRDIPRQQVVEFADSVVSNSLDDEAQISFRVEVVEFRRADQAVNRGGTITAGIRAGKQEILASKGDARNARSAALLSISMRPSEA
jgi:hypothetical protein